MTEFDDVSKPYHYNQHPSGVECRELLEVLTYYPAAALKYLWRYEDKENPEQDLDKCIQYLEFAAEFMQKHGLYRLPPKMVFDEWVERCEKYLNYEGWRVDNPRRFTVFILMLQEQGPKLTNIQYAIRIVKELKEDLKYGRD